VNSDLLEKARARYNLEAINAYNEHVGKYGVFGDGLRGF
jgi:post-segregation antitoxin (ccd killing protein)